MSRQRTILVLAVASQAAFSMITFGLPAIGAEIRDRFDLGPAGFGAVFAAVGLGLAAALVLAGIGGAAVPVAGMTALLRVFAPAQRGMAMGWRQLGVPLGGTLGAAILPALAAVGGVRLAMAGAGVA